MGNYHKPLTEREARELVEEADKYANVAEAAKAMGIQRRTLSSRLYSYVGRFGITSKHVGRTAQDARGDTLEIPDFPDEAIPVEELIAQRKAKFEKKRASYDAHTWFQVKVKDKLPIGLLSFGDPHVDDNGCNWPELERHIEIAKQPGVYSIQVGDVTNNWVGRLMRLYAVQSTSVSEARQLAEWFMLKSGVRWLLWILGNHDVWGDGADILAQMAKRYGTQKLVCHDWEARFSLTFSTGWAPRIYVAHDFKGWSMWNPAHGPMREGQMGEIADLYICGDKHQSIDVEWENAAKGLDQHFVRVRGFKFMDDYARRNGYKEQATGCSSLAVFDPKRNSIKTYKDVEEGAEFLQWKRARG